MVINYYKFNIIINLNKNIIINYEKKYLKQ